MEIPENFGQITLEFGGTNFPDGASVTFGLHNSLDRDAIEVAELAGDAWVTNVIPEQENGTTLLLARCKLGPVTTGPMAEFSYNVPGGDDETALVRNTALLVQKLTQLGGREGRGRMFVPGLSEETINGVGGVAAAKLAAWQSAFDGFWTELDTEDIPMFLLHNSETNPTVVTSLVVSPVVATQRRRLRR